MSSSIFAQDLRSRDTRPVPCTITAQFQTGLANSARQSTECPEFHSGIKTSLIRSPKSFSHSNITMYIPVARNIRSYLMLESLAEMEQEPDTQLQ